MNMNTFEEFEIETLQKINVKKMEKFEKTNNMNMSEKVEKTNVNKMEKFEQTNNMNIREKVEKTNVNKSEKFEKTNMNKSEERLNNSCLKRLHESCNLNNNSNNNEINSSNDNNSSKNSSKNNSKNNSKNINNNINHHHRINTLKESLDHWVQKSVCLFRRRINTLYGGVGVKGVGVLFLALLSLQLADASCRNSEFFSVRFLCKKL